MKKFDLEKYRYIICFMLLTGLCFLFPYTGDDWAWGSSIGIERLNTWFDNYSGRYLGNLIVLVLTRSNIIKALVMAFCLTGIFVCIEKLLKKKWAFYLSMALFVLLPRAIFRQAVAWTAGFANYVTSIFLTLLFIVYMYHIFEDKVEKQDFKMCIPLFLLGIANTLIVEHLTLYNVVLALFVIIFTYIKFKKIYIQYILYFTGTILGTVIMFSNSVYSSIQMQEDGYRSVAQNGIIQQITESYFKIIYKELISGNLWVNLALLLAFLNLYVMLKKDKVSSKKMCILKVCLYVMGIFVTWTFLSVTGIGDSSKPHEFMYLEGIFSLLFLVAVITSGIIISLHYGNFWRIAFILGSILCMTAPLFVVNPIGSRCFFATYCMFAVLLCELLRIFPNKDFLFFGVKRACVIISISGFAFYSAVFLLIYKSDKDRIKYVRQEVSANSKEIEIIHLPFEGFVWTPTPVVEPWITRYKLFYNIPEDIDLIPVWEYTLEQKE